MLTFNFSKRPDPQRATYVTHLLQMTHLATCHFRTKKNALVVNHMKPFNVKIHSLLT